MKTAVENGRGVSQRRGGDKADCGEEIKSISGYVSLDVELCQASTMSRKSLVTKTSCHAHTHTLRPPVADLIVLILLVPLPPTFVMRRKTHASFLLFATNTGRLEHL